ncbi:hypothetical protein FNV43_RR19826 [Rhamnella rubrinervis]|uniref:FAS1 domain-containing protein n=1 Tax=Rhamnella rubrinervis TaxID=2594499 RepID=A0A8K0DZ83_9ROSA|nr:hypothetical protein FNV43_RR19826 [Rhamnella rubrinervis]
MATNLFSCLLCFLLLLLPSQTEGNNLAMVSSILSEKGYHAMSLTFDDMFLHTLQIDLTGNSSTLTLLCPPDHAFLSSKLYPQPPLTLLQYHLVPFKLSRDELVSLPLGSKVETLLHGHPLVVTTLPGSEYVTLNEVPVTEWDVYNDGRLVIHGVDDFLDPAYQTLRYPWYDAEEIHAKVVAEFSWIMGKVTENWFIVLLSLLMIALLVLILVSSSSCVEYCRHRDYHLVI